MIKVTPYKETYKKAVLATYGLTDEKRDFLAEDTDNLGDYSEYLVAFDEKGLCVGFAKTTLLLKGYIELDDIFVAENIRREGVGSLILVAVLTRAVDKFALHVMAKCPRKAGDGVCFFKTRGFAVQSENSDTDRIYLKKDILYMYKR